MNVTRDVVTDLLPVYLSGEASPDTKALVEEFLQHDPELARIAREGQIEKGLGLPRGEGRCDAELQALSRTRGLLRRRGWLLALAIFFTTLPLSFAWSSERGFVWTMWRDSPAVAATSLAVGVVSWIGYILTRRRLRTTAL